MKTITRLKYAVMERFEGGQRFLGDYDTRERPAVGRIIAIKNRGVFKICERQDPSDREPIGTLYVKSPSRSSR